MILVISRFGFEGWICVLVASVPGFLHTFYIYLFTNQIIKTKIKISITNKLNVYMYVPPLDLKKNERLITKIKFR